MFLERLGSQSFGGHVSKFDRAPWSEGAFTGLLKKDSLARFISQKDCSGSVSLDQ